MTRVRTLLLACLACAASAPVLADKVYQWTDADGVTHYADEPPPTGDYRDRDLATPDPVPSAAPASTPPAQATARDDCAQARRNLENLASGGDVGFDRDGDGAMDEAMTPAQREAQLGVARSAIERRCGGPAG